MRPIYWLTIDLRNLTFQLQKGKKKTIIIHAIALETRASTLTVTSTQIYIFESLIALFTKSFWYMFLCCIFNNYIVSIPLCYHTLFFFYCIEVSRGIIIHFNLL